MIGNLLHHYQHGSRNICQYPPDIGNAGIEVHTPGNNFACTLADTESPEQDGINQHQGKGGVAQDAMDGKGTDLGNYDHHDGG